MTFSVEGKFDSVMLIYSTSIARRLKGRHLVTGPKRQPFGNFAFAGSRVLMSLQQYYKVEQQIWTSIPVAQF